jgi:hypothetical protein
MTQFDTNAPQYRCCCKCCHVRVGLLLTNSKITILQIGGLIIGILMLASINLYIASSFGGIPHLIVSVVFGSMTFIAGVLLIVGIMKERPLLLFPAIIIMVRTYQMLLQTSFNICRLFPLFYTSFVLF